MSRLALLRCMWMPTAREQIHKGAKLLVLCKANGYPQSAFVYLTAENHLCRRCLIK